MEKENANNIIDLFIDLEYRLLRFTKTIPFKGINKDVTLPLLSSIIVECGSLIDTIFREEYPSCTNKKDLDITNFAQNYRKLESINTLLLIYPPRIISPYMGWIDKNGKYCARDWWQNYNSLKHGRIQNWHLATLSTAINIMAALHQVISQPSFIESLVLNNMVSYDNDLTYILEHIKKNTVEFTILIESELFATPFGKRSFPSHPNEIQPINFSMSKKLIHFLGRSLGKGQ